VPDRVARLLFRVVAICALCTTIAAAQTPGSAEAPSETGSSDPVTLIETRAAEALGLGETVFRSLFPAHLQGPDSRRLGLESWQWIVLGALVLLAFIVDRVTRIVVRRFLRRRLTRLRMVSEEQVHGAERPIGLFAGTLVLFAVIGGVGLPPAVQGALILAIRVLLALTATWALWHAVDIVAASVMQRAQTTSTKLDDLLVPVLRRALKIMLVIVGALFVAEATGIRPTSLLAGLGLGGLAFALAAKDTVENLFGFATLLFDRPFQIGDWVVVKGAEGTVEEIGMRSTRIRTSATSVISVPNGQLVNAAIDNMGVRRYRRYSAKMDIGYGTSPQRLEALTEGIREIIRLHPYTRKDYFQVYLNELGESGLKVMLYVFHEVPEWSTELRERHRFLIDVLKLAARLQVELAFPTRTLHLPGLEAEVSRLGAARAAESRLAAPDRGDFDVTVPDDTEGARRTGREVALQVVREELAEGEIPAPVSI